ncbi:hypothetical protein TNCV_3845871 [Trichonephila clavipes]|nr:hypothetical protein TNCV_3845871 [Trichonephila clavipes]
MTTDFRYHLPWRKGLESSTGEYALLFVVQVDRVTQRWMDEIRFPTSECSFTSLYKAVGELLATDLIILHSGQVTRATSEQEHLLQTTTLHQWEDMEPRPIQRASALHDTPATGQATQFPPKKLAC